MKKFLGIDTNQYDYNTLDCKSPTNGMNEDSKFDSAFNVYNQQSQSVMVTRQEANQFFGRDLQPIQNLQKKQIPPPKLLGPVNDKIKTVRIELLENKNKKPQAKGGFHFPQEFQQTFKAEVKAKDLRFKELAKTMFIFYTHEDLLSQLSACSYFRGFQSLDFDHIKHCLFPNLNGGTNIQTNQKKKSNIQESKYYVTLTDEGEFHGQMNKNKTPEGSAIFYYKNGNKYVGEMKNRFRHGKGTMVWPDGSLYQGQWTLDAQDGLGQEINAQGEIFTGTFSNNARSGKGYVLEAIWVNGYQEGPSKLNVGNQIIDVTWNKGQIIKVNQTCIDNGSNSCSLPANFIEIQVNKGQVNVQYDSPYCLTAHF